MKPETIKRLNEKFDELFEEAEADERGLSGTNDLLVGDILHLHLKFEYFDAIASGKKKEEYRDAEKWLEKLLYREYDGIRLYRGYEKVSESTVIDLPYKGYELKTITHPHFGNVPTVVCAIDVAH